MARSVYIYQLMHPNISMWPHSYLVYINFNHKQKPIILFPKHSEKISSHVFEFTWEKPHRASWVPPLMHRLWGSLGVNHHFDSLNHPHSLWNTTENDSSASLFNILRLCCTDLCGGWLASDVDLNHYNQTSLQANCSAATQFCLPQGWTNSSALCVLLRQKATFYFVSPHGLYF